MKKILFLLLLTVSSYGQTLQNPTFGNTTTNTLKIKTPATVTSVNYLSTIEVDGSIAKIAPVSLPFLTKVSTVTTNAQAYVKRADGTQTMLDYVSSTVINDSGVIGVSVADAFNTLNTLKANVTNPTFFGTVSIADNQLGSTPNKLKQIMASGQDYWSIYGETNVTDQGIMVLEVGDNGQPFSSIGQKFEFRYTAGSSGTPKTPFEIDYNTTVANTDFYVKGDTYIRKLRTLNDLNTNIGLLGSYFDAFGSGSKDDVLAFVYGNNHYKIATNAAVQLDINGAGVVNVTNLAGTGTRTVVADASGNLSATATPPDPRPYKVYTALIYQTGTSAPTAVVLENTLGGTVVLSYASVGTYDLTLTGGFNTNKTIVFLTKQYNSSSNIILSGSFLSTNTVRILTSNNTALQDAQLSGASIEIRVYP